jgi:hypothetical protein
VAGLTWFELDVDFHDDPKVKALCSRLRNPCADSYVSRLYAYCYKHATDRFPPESAADTLEDVCRWRGRKGVLFDALFAVEVLEREAGRVVVHGVKARLAPHLAKREADRIRIAEKRDKAADSLRRRGDVAATTTRRRANVAGNTDIDTNNVVLTNDVAPPAKIQPLGVHIQGQCPDLVAAVQRAAEAGVGVSVGRRAVLWGEADGLVRQLGADAVHAAWVQAAAKRAGDPGDVPLAYLIHPLRSLAAGRGRQGARGPQPVSQDYSKTLADVAREREEALRAKRQ